MRIALKGCKKYVYDHQLYESDVPFYVVEQDVAEELLSRTMNDRPLFVVFKDEEYEDPRDKDYKHPVDLTDQSQNAPAKTAKKKVAKKKATKKVNIKKNKSQESDESDDGQEEKVTVQ